MCGGRPCHALEVRSTEQSLSIVHNTDAARKSAAEAQEKWQQRIVVEYQPTDKRQKNLRGSASPVIVDVALTMFKKSFSTLFEILRKGNLLGFLLLAF